MVQEYVEIIVAVTALLSTIGGFLVLFPKTRQLGQSLKETDAWVLENQAKILQIAEASERLAAKVAPEQVAEARVKFSELVYKYKGDLEAAKADLELIYGPLGELLAPVVKENTE